MAFLALFKKELRLELPSFLMVEVFLLGIAFYVFSRFDESLPRLFLLLPMGMIIPFFGLLRMFQNLRSEWSGDTIQWILSLPASGWQQLGAKWLAVLASMVLVALTIGALVYPVLLQTPIADQLGTMTPSVLQLLTVIGIFFACYLPLAMFSYLVGRGIPKWRAPVVGVVFLGGTYVFNRLFETAADYLPPVYITVKNIEMTPDSLILTDHVLNVSGIFGTVFFGYLLFHASVRLWARRIDV